MFNHSVDNCEVLIPLVEKPFAEDFNTLCTLENAVKKRAKLDYIWQFPEGGWVVVTKRRGVSISSVSDDNLQLALAAMSAVSSIKELYISSDYVSAVKNFYGDSVKDVHNRVLLKNTSLKSIQFEERSDIHIPPATADDIHQITLWAQNLAKENDDANLADYERMLSIIKTDVANGHIFLICNNVQPIGYVFYKEAGEGCLKRIHINHIYIDKPYRKFGIARYVLSKTLKSYAENSGEKATIIAHSESKFIIDFYKSLGFKVTQNLSVVYLKD